MQDEFAVYMTRSLARARRLGVGIVQDLQEGVGGFCGTAMSTRDAILEPLHSVSGVWIHRVRPTWPVEDYRWESVTLFPVDVVEISGKVGRPERNRLPAPELLHDQPYLSLMLLGRRRSLREAADGLCRLWKETGGHEWAFSAGAARILVDVPWNINHEQGEEEPRSWFPWIARILGSGGDDDARRERLLRWLDARWTSMLKSLCVVRNRGRHKLVPDLRFNRAREKQRFLRED